jgi:hypothetical protein
MDVYLQAQQMSEWLLFNANSSTIFQLYHYNFQWDEDEVRFVLDQYANLDFYSASSLKQQSVDRYVAPIGHIVFIPSLPVLAACLAEQQQIPISQYLVWPGRGSIHFWLVFNANFYSISARSWCEKTMR